MTPWTAPERDDAALLMARIAREAGALLLAMQGSDLARERKSDGSPVSDADRAADTLVTAGLQAAFPDIPVVSEENAASQILSGAARFFLVDPLDGTHAYLRGGQDYCVLIALIEQGAPIAGAMDAPAHARRHWSGARAWRAAGDDLRGEPLVPSPPCRQPTAIISAHHAGEQSLALCRTLGVERVLTENSALKFARLAEGDADFYPRAGNTMEWDIATGDALLRALGGGILDSSGAAMVYGRAPGDWLVPSFIAYRSLG